MGSVWLADRSDGRFEGAAAVKLLSASLMGREGEARFKLEGSILARLRHPHCEPDRSRSVELDLYPFLSLHPREDRLGDRSRPLASRVIRRHHRSVTSALCYPPHRCPLGRVANWAGVVGVLRR